MNSEDLVAWLRQRSPLDEASPHQKIVVENNDRIASRFISEAIKNEDPNYEYEYSPTHGAHGVLHVAAQQGYVEAVRDLLGLGADANAHDDRLNNHEHGLFTPLHYAAWFGRARIVEILVQEGGVGADTLSSKNQTALCLAVDQGYLRTTKAFLRLGSEPEHTLSPGVHPSFYCIQSFHCGRINPARR
jgi:ankyrin repeat protein